MGSRRQLNRALEDVQALTWSRECCGHALSGPSYPSEHTGLQGLDHLLPLSEATAEPLLRFLVLLPPGVGLPGVYPGGVLPGTGENEKDGLGM